MQCTHRYVGNYSNPSFGPFSQVIQSFLDGKSIDEMHFLGVCVKRGFGRVFGHG